jgi:hypothetical protein
MLEVFPSGDLPLARALILRLPDRNVSIPELLPSKYIDVKERQCQNYENLDDCRWKCEHHQASSLNHQSYITMT